MATDPASLAQSGAPAAAEITTDDFSALLQKEFKPRTDEAKSRVEMAVRTLAEQALAGSNVMPGDVIGTIESMISALDRTLTEQVNVIIHNEEFQALESAWRGLQYTVFNTETSTDLKIKVMNVSKDELRKMFSSYRGASWDQSPLFKKVYEQEFGQLGGQPYGCLMGDYYFSQSPTDVEVLEGMAKVSSASHAPFISGTSPALFGMDSWQDLTKPRDLAKIFDTPEYAAWRSLRAKDDSRYIALTMPRVLARKPYGATSEPVEQFAFEEDTGGDHDKYNWMNAAHAMAVRITAAHKEFGWCTRIRGVQSGGTVEGLPTAMFPTDDGDTAVKCPTEVAISDRREGELSAAGLIGLIHRKNTDQATFIGGQTLHMPKEYADKGATANARLSARLPYLFTSARFAHYLKCMVRDWVGGTPTVTQLQRRLQDWVQLYVDGMPDMSSEAQKARQPLKAAQIDLSEDEENPGYYRASFQFVPHFQMEGMDISLSMTSSLRQAGG
ncbi:type VI secretion system contractile sheath large subunit [Glacieibacterium megasporae]|uniref:type VI secretion system contractile sheath large subunit n=1 Tax=Glacieibacterium megasporae TaxID=2835787 RepID=UPI001C1E61EF|nr:type VI secretion system contractile sheath large subunit [Polymorphobacter megasporae]UAJ09837.1 type VI secretion system contractile sheath large subunit [Polymorphobacter megasporae]